MAEKTLTLNINTEPEHAFSPAGMWDYFAWFQGAGVPGVGSVTIKYGFWQQVAVAIKSIDRNNKDRAMRKRAVSLIMVAANFMRKACGLGKGKSRFTDPLAVVMEENSPDSMTINKALVFKGLEMGKIMSLPFFNAQRMVNGNITKSEKLGLQNMLAWSMFMEKCGRMIQEGVIDAAKTGLIPRLVLADEMDAISLISRKDKINLKIDFKKETDAVDLPASTASRTYPVKTMNGVKTVYEFADMFDFIRREAASSALTDEVISSVATHKQKLSEDLALEAGKLLGKHGKVEDSVRLLMEVFHSVFDTKKALRQEFEGVKGDSLRDALVLFEERQTTLFRSISSTARTVLGNNRLFGREAALFVLGVTFKYMNKEADRPSSFVSTILAEEFAALALSMLDENDPRRFTRDKLFTEEELVDGEQIDLVDGCDSYGRAIFTEEVGIPDGTYTVREEVDENGRSHYFAEASVAEMLLDRVEKEYDPNSLIFQTLSEGLNINELKKKIQKGKEVLLVPEWFNPYTRKKVYNAVVVDGYLVASYKGKVKRQTFDEEDGCYVDMVNEQTKKVEYDRALDIMNLYRLAIGKVSLCQEGFYFVENKKREILFVALKDVHKAESTILNSMQDTLARSVACYEKAKSRVAF